MVDTAGVYHPFLDMCCYCEMDTGGNHIPTCPLNKMKPSWDKVIRRIEKEEDDNEDISLGVVKRFNSVEELIEDLNSEANNGKNL